MYKWQTDGSISWRDGYYNSHPDLPLSVSTTEWDDAYAAFSGSWSLFGIVKGLLDLIAAIPTGRYWLNPVLDSTILTAPVIPAPSEGDRYLIDGTGAGGWAGHSNCIAEYESGAWVFYESGGTPPYDLSDGASVWDETHNTYWVFNDDPSPEWVQCGGTTLEKVITVGTPGTYVIDGMKERGAVFIGEGSGNIVFELPDRSEGLRFRVLRGTPAGSNHVDIVVASGSDDVIRLSAKSLILDSSDPLIPQQLYRQIRLVAQNDYVDLVCMKDGWNIVGGIASINDRSPTDGDTAQGASDTTHITLALAASSNDDEYIGRLIYLTDGIGEGQIRMITDYVGNTRVATVYPAWTTQPDGTSVYDMVDYATAVIGMGEIGTAFMNTDKDAYPLAEGLFAEENYPSISRYAGLNYFDTWGSMLLGRAQKALSGAQYSSGFGYGGNARWDSQFLFGSPAPTASVKDPQVSRILLYGTPKAGGVAEPMRIGTGAGEIELTMDNSRLYYVTFSIAVTYGNTHPPKLISWSGSFLAFCNYLGAVSIVSGSENITETGNSGTPAITLDISAASGLPQFLLANSELLDQAKAVGFADVIEVESAGAPS